MESFRKIWRWWLPSDLDKTQNAMKRYSFGWHVRYDAASNKCKPRTNTWPTLGKCVTFSHLKHHILCNAMSVCHRFAVLWPPLLGFCTQTWLKCERFFVTLSTTSPDFEPVELKWTELKMCHSTYVGLFVLLLCLGWLFLVAWSSVCILNFSSVTTIFHLCECMTRLVSSAYQPNKHNCNLARINLCTYSNLYAIWHNRYFEIPLQSWSHSTFSKITCNML